MTTVLCGATAGATADAQVMTCMEVWGGNQVVDTGVAMAGLDAWVYSKPYGEADGGGDVYYVSSCATGRITRLLVADVSGHGADVCDVAGQLRTLMRKYVNFLNPTRFVRSMNEQFASFTASGCFATAVVTTFFAPTNQLSLCNAGHPPPLLYRVATGRWEYMERADAEDEEPKNIPLGIIELSNYDQFDETLAVGDLVLCYTDSLVESYEPDGSMLGQEGLLRVIQTIDPTDPATFTPKLLAAIAAKVPGNLTNDDVTVLLFRPNGQAIHTPFRDKLLAPARVLRGVASSLRHRTGPLPWPEVSLVNLGGAMFGPFNRFWRGVRR